MNLKISNVIELDKYVILVIYTDLDTMTNDVVLVKNIPRAKSSKELYLKSINTICKLSKKRQNENRTEEINLEFDIDFYEAVTAWCNSLKISLKQLAYAFIEFICIDENRNVVIPWMKELKNEQ